MGRGRGSTPDKCCRLHIRWGLYSTLSPSGRLGDAVSSPPSVAATQRNPAKDFSTPSPSLRVQATASELSLWCTEAVGLRKDVADSYVHALFDNGFDSPAALAMASEEELMQLRIRPGHARLMLAKADALRVAPPLAAGGIPPPKLFDYETIKANVHVADAIESVEAAFGMLARGKVNTQRR